ncbi:aminotransferase class III-fold pyridoxal phosphate-dependent enzyme [Synechococcus sp. HB1133]|uniref:aminotransferase class III-fold pyridoxal phosphate-dependent enzyme n=1 Tax=unclassified Synechococcus TaxID=2626047 RepID=UPI00140B0FCD|nr:MULTISPECIES: aminotransferase class III-fold pyridoxal phosphate-dependent enzyme [unclassified Synechococcus]MCB4421666.1 aminotransferase class III-fold pyridoxal phosphate-dependent enzyme [Synechococcus sp. HB1133]MCB4430982.1 aminotransferase class III-fold pyridoxal phosphate-dependent enzyme [Synechococcus sp. HBA1120]NHI80608.1 aminotransferase class III-fold pyridoxal phosphate-dependent enzyme [Synechococcus sp. HB1133]
MHVINDPKVKVIAVVQARSNSLRFPRKIYHEILPGISMLQYVLERIKVADSVDQIVVATSLNSENDEIIPICNEMGVKVYRGDENNVLSRFVDISRLYPASHYLRITADCPLVDPRTIEEAIGFCQSFDYITTGPKYTDGFDVELISREVFAGLSSDAVSAFDEEHVTSFIHSSSQYTKKVLVPSVDMPSCRLSVDEPNDFQVVSAIINSISTTQSPFQFSLIDVVEFLADNPQILLLNSMNVPNAGSNMNSGQKLWRRAKKVIPGGNMLLSKRPEMFLPEGWPSYFSRSSGCKVWDLDGNEYIDMTIMGIGTNILGYGRREVDDQVNRVIVDGNMSSLNCPEEVYLAERLVSMHPWADMCRFARSGGEANSIAIRIARAHTNRDKVAFCGYHGWHDWYLATNLPNKDGLNEHLLPGLEPLGVPKQLSGTALPFMFNDSSAVRKIVDQHDLAAIKLEVQRTDPPNPDFLFLLRELCDANGIVLIFDECTSGFRESFGGIHLNYPVEPDMAMFGKALGNGYAVTAVIGREEVMQAAQSTFISSTFWTERIGSVAALATLDIMEKEKSWKTITELGTYLRSGWQNLADKYDLSIKHFCIPSLAGFYFDSSDSRLYKTLISQEMLSKGYLAGTSCYMSTAHTAEIINKYLLELDPVFEMIRACEDGAININQILRYPACHDKFSRLN